MQSLVSDLVARFETGQLSRRDFVATIAALAAAGPAVAAPAPQAELDFKTATIDHMSIQVADMQKSAAFYQRMFGFKVISEDKPLGILRLGNTKTLVSLNTQKPAGIMDHFAIGVPNFTKEAAARYAISRGAMPLDDPYAGLHIKDPDGINVQIFGQG